MKCEKKENLYIVSEISENLESKEICSALEIEDLWPILKRGDSLALKSASDFFGFSHVSSFSPVLSSPEYYNNIKESKTILQKISGLKPSVSGASRLSPYTKHKSVIKVSRSHINQKSANYEETTEGKNETILVSEYRKYKKTADRDGNLEVLHSNIHGLGLFTNVE